MVVEPGTQNGRAFEAPGRFVFGLDPFRYRFEVRATGGEDELVGDHRLLSFRVETATPRRGRPLRCSHPSSRGRVDPERVIRRAGGEDLDFAEDFDLRMYCFGRTLELVRAGATLVPEYGFARGSSRSYVARKTSEARARPLGRVEGAGFVPFPASASTPRPDGPPVLPGLAPADVALGGHVVLHPYVEARRDGVRFYLRDDLWTLRVRRPDGGERVCAMSPQPVVPIVDFFSKPRRGGRVGSTIDAMRHCPEGTFDQVGIYEVVPDVDLQYDGSRQGFDAVTGRFRGYPGYVRVRPPRNAYTPYPPLPRSP